MTNIRLALSAHESCWNPFGVASFDDISQLTIVQMEQFVDQLQRPGFALQFLGKPGRVPAGKPKSTRKLQPPDCIVSCTS